MKLNIGRTNGLSLWWKTRKGLIVNILTPEQIMASTDFSVHVRYVRLSTGEYRFSDACSGSSHKNMVNEGETPVSAAFIFVYKDRIQIDDYSMTLQMGPCEADYVELPQLFNLPERKE